VKNDIQLAVAKAFTLVGSLVFLETLGIAIIWPERISLGLAIVSTVAFVVAVVTMAWIMWDRNRDED
jgi:hypothetical protein